MRRGIRNACAVLAVALLCSAVGSTAAAPALTEERAQLEEASPPAFVVALADGYAVEGATPEPDRREGGHLAWDAGTDLSGFELTASEESTDDSDGSDGSDGDGQDGTNADSSDGDGDGTDGDASAGGSGPGFGPVVAALAVLGVALLVARRR